MTTETMIDAPTRTLSKDEAATMRKLAKIAAGDHRSLAIGHVWHVGRELWATDGKRFHFAKIETEANEPHGYLPDDAKTAKLEGWTPKPWTGTDAYLTYRKPIERVVASIDRDTASGHYVTFTARRDGMAIAAGRVKASLPKESIGATFTAEDGAGSIHYAAEGAESWGFAVATAPKDRLSCAFQPKFIMEALDFIGGKVVTCRMPKDGKAPAILSNEDGTRLAVIMPVTIKKRK